MHTMYAGRRSAGPRNPIREAGAEMKIAAQEPTDIPATPEGRAEHSRTGPNPSSGPASNNPCDAKASGTALVIEFPPATADRLRTAARRAGSTPASMAEKALQFWLRRDEYRAARRAAHANARLAMERLRAEGRLNPQPPGQPRKQEGTPR